MQRAHLAWAVHDSCLQELRAFKPGNVSVAAPGHGMDAADFLRSAAAVTSPLTTPGMPAGARIETAIEATWSVVSCNTNLGIVLLMAPLLCAAETLPEDCSLENLRSRLVAVLAALDLDDARRCYRAIRRARPGGLGASARHDVAAEPQVSLLFAMQEAAARDGVAHEYAHGYPTVLEVGAASLRNSAARGEAELWAITRCYLRLLARAPDSHVTRRHGAAAARAVQERAAQIQAAWPEHDSAACVWPQLRDCDYAWKAAGINPGTTADLVAASLLVMRLTGAQGYNGGRLEPDA
jgi:triphosphoribosyl-dephospho-CoA synthase